MLCPFELWAHNQYLNRVKIECIESNEDHHVCHYIIIVVRGHILVFV